MDILPTSNFLNLCSVTSGGGNCTGTEGEEVIEGVTQVIILWVIMYNVVATYITCHAASTDEWPIKWPLICGRGMMRGTVNI